MKTLDNLFTATEKGKELICKAFSRNMDPKYDLLYSYSLELITICKRNYGVKVWNGSFLLLFMREERKQKGFVWNDINDGENEIHYYFEWHKLHKMTKRDWICCFHRFQQAFVERQTINFSIFFFHYLLVCNTPFIINGITSRKKNFSMFHCSCWIRSQ